MSAVDAKKINNIKELNINDLKSLCSDIRADIINTVSDNGGYLSSNLSIVEITVALEKVFGLHDKIIYNGPDMNYAYRLIKNENMLNEEYCNCLSNGLGIAVARDINHDTYNVISVINSNSEFANIVESLNHIGDEKRKMIIVFNDDTSIDKGIGLVDKFVSNLRNTKTYTNIKDNVKDFIRPQKGGDKIIEGIHNIKSNIKKAVVDEGVFGEYNIDYIGPIDGHNINELIRAFEIAKTKNYPCVVHCITTKGKGYVYAESNTDEAWNKTGPFDIKTGKTYIEETENLKNCTKLVCESLMKLMSENKDIVLISPNNKNVSKLMPIFAKYPDRSFDANSSVSDSLGFACGFSMNNKIPFISLKSSSLSKCYDVLMSQIDELNKAFIISLINDDDNDIQILNNLKNTIVCNVCNPNEIDKIFDKALSINNPFIIRYPDKFIEVNANSYEISNIGKWQLIVNNDLEKICIISNGLNVDKIKKLIIENKLNYSLINANYINPIDNDLLDLVFKKCKKLYLYNSGLDNKIINIANISQFKGQIKALNSEDINELFETINKDNNA